MSRRIQLLSAAALLVGSAAIVLVCRAHRRRVMPSDTGLDRTTPPLAHRGLAFLGVTPRAYRDVTPAVRRFIRRALRGNLVVTSTTGGQHAPNSYHYSGRAADVAGTYGRMRAFYIQEVKRELRGGGTQYLELFGPGKSYIKNGIRKPGQFPAHEDHIHGAPKGIQ